MPSSYFIMMMMGSGLREKIFKEKNAFVTAAV